MARVLPPLTALPGFDAAARHLSFTKAAAELNLTHGAISRAIRNIEERLGIKLFERGTRSVSLTPAGAAYAAEIGAALDRMSAATIVATAPRSAGVLNISTSDAFAGRWLVPRFHRFHRAHRDIDVRISTSGHLADFVRDGIDIAIRYGGGEYEGVVSEFLSEVEVFPVCSPELLKGDHPLKQPSDLKYHTLIHDGFPIDWALWLQRAGVTDVNPSKGVSFESGSHASEAAVHGEGVLLGRSALISDDLASGKLVRPFHHKMLATSKYYIVYLPGALRQRKVRAFRDWLVEEMAADRKREEE
ncbi:transcriptional regulator GcvA [Chelativorans salis]|uniref:Transcriptional regulator GcvA n=1 Tax=Chelativorans salis TaxID=2978478 RepID=A0ABT2LJZ4_9HYPH|nr:transcriptional regulator GcvA [Chelativorans sp. EGI FJ00035]MCT7374339.1 transcriptional regulator GcvA [Chelativorans sp. EGI FJ00035]